MRTSSVPVKRSEPAIGEEAAREENTGPLVDIGIRHGNTYVNKGCEMTVQFGSVRQSSTVDRQSSLAVLFLLHVSLLAVHPSICRRLLVPAELRLLRLIR